MREKTEIWISFKKLNWKRMSEKCLTESLAHELSSIMSTNKTLIELMKADEKDVHADI